MYFDVFSTYPKWTMAGLPQLLHHLVSSGNELKLPERRVVMLMGSCVFFTELILGAVKSSQHCSFSKSYWHGSWSVTGLALPAPIGFYILGYSPPVCYAALSGLSRALVASSHSSLHFVIL